MADSTVHAVENVVESGLHYGLVGRANGSAKSARDLVQKRLQSSVASDADGFVVLGQKQDIVQVVSDYMAFHSKKTFIYSYSY